MTAPPEIAITMHNLGKRYKIYHSNHDRLKEALHPLRKIYHEPFWVLRGLNLEIPKGAIVGIIGANGAGKSTLLEMVTGVTQPTEGSIQVNGRIAALLELGAGFNVDFTGRENVRLNATIMGMNQEEMARRLPEIESFADIGEFFDQPVRIYSSGMFVRVAFAMSIMVDPDILVIDEALAVGDTRFQHRCYHALRSFIQRGKTLLLVSHDVSILQRFCTHGVLLNQGRMVFHGPISETVNRYQEIINVRTGTSKWEEGPEEQAVAPTYNNEVNSCPIPRGGAKDCCATHASYNPLERRVGDGRVVVIDYALEVDGVVDPPEIRFDATWTLYVKILFREAVDNVSVGFAIVSKENQLVGGSNMVLRKYPLLQGSAGEVKLISITNRMELTGGDYFLNIGCHQEIEGKDNLFLDARRGLALLRIQETPWCTGSVTCHTKFSEL